MSGGIFQQIGDVTTPYGFTGEMEEPNNMLYLRARHYSHDLGRFISQDPYEGSINEPMSLNRYAYAHNNPVNRTDPSGLTPMPAGLLGSLASSSLWQFANMMNLGGMCISMQQTPDCQEYLRMHPRPSIMGLILHGCGTTSPPSIQPGEEILPGITPTPGGLLLPVEGGRLSNCEYATRPETGIPSRDINPPNVTIPVPVYAPANAEVMIVDTTGDNEGLGNFVAIRIHTSNLPPQIASRIGGSGYVYLGYAHLSQVYVQAVGNSPYTPVSAGQPIGMTGSTGTDNVHLDVTVFFIPEVNAFGAEPAPRSTGTEENVGSTVVPEHQHFQSFYTLGLPGLYEPQNIDPLLLWPELVQGTICAGG